jgi:rhodanese-related sulfurtransferase
MKYLFISMLMLSLTGCVDSGGSNSTPPSQATEQKAQYKKITPEQAQKLISEKADIVILDVRTEAEFKEKRIAKSILIPDYEIKTKATEILKDKSATILVYCRSGRRSASASQQLVAMGYKNVYDFGGIIDWPYETISGD